jgi:hypothetical protein
MPVFVLLNNNLNVVFFQKYQGKKYLTSFLSGMVSPGFSLP